MTIADKYIQVLEHRGKPAPTRALARIVDDPYNMTTSEYQAEKSRIKSHYKEKNRATQKKLTQSVLGSIRRKPQKWLSYREQKKKELADLETKYRRSKIDRKYGNVPGAWREDERGRYPVGTQGKPKHHRGHQPGYKFKDRTTTARGYIEEPRDDYVDAEWSQLEEPVGYIPQRTTRREISGYISPGIQRPAIGTSPSRTRSALPDAPRRLALPPGKPSVKELPYSPKAIPLTSPTRRRVTALLPQASKAAKRIKKRRGSRR